MPVHHRLRLVVLVPNPALFLMLTHIPQIAQAVKACLDALARVVAWLLTLFRPDSGTPLSPGGGSGFSGFGTLLIGMRVSK